MLWKSASNFFILKKSLLMAEAYQNKTITFFIISAITVVFKIQSNHFDTAMY